jgi:hypothetical protein
MNIKSLGNITVNNFVVCNKTGQRRDIEYVILVCHKHTLMDKVL